jgi:hypothetical protein
MSGERLTCQDWYRVRRGEDQLAWARAGSVASMPGVTLSERARAEYAFMPERQRREVARTLTSVAADPSGATSSPVEHGGERRVAHIGEVYVVFVPDAHGIAVSTIRGGPVLDPEAVGPAPEVA